MAIRKLAKTSNSQNVNILQSEFIRMNTITHEELLDAGVHFGHMTHKWNPAMAPYIFMKKDGIHIIDVLKTQKMLEEAQRVVKQLSKSGRKILFVGTKKQAREILEEYARSVGMPFITERWLGGMLTNFATVRKSVRKMSNLDKLVTGDNAVNISKKEKLMISRNWGKLDRVFGGIADMAKLPAALFIVDSLKEHIAIAEAKRLNIPTIAIVDTNSNPNSVDFPIPANDDSTKSIEFITKCLVEAIKEGNAERKTDKETEEEKETANTKD